MCAGGAGKAETRRLTLITHVPLSDGDVSLTCLRRNETKCTLFSWENSLKRTAIVVACRVFIDLISDVVFQIPGGGIRIDKCLKADVPGGACVNFKKTV